MLRARRPAFRREPETPVFELILTPNVSRVTNGATHGSTIQHQEPDCIEPDVMSSL